MMIDTLKIPFWCRLLPARSAAASHSAPHTCHSPVFIHDAITPCLGETVLLKILREQAKAEGNQS